LTHFKKIKIQIVKNPHLGFLGSFDMLFLVLQANYGEKISLMQIFSLVNPNAPGLKVLSEMYTGQFNVLTVDCVATIITELCRNDNLANLWGVRTGAACMRSP